jgi:hypothetical protein
MSGVDDRLPLPAALAQRLPAVAEVAVRRLQVVEERFITRGSLNNAQPQKAFSETEADNIEQALREV